MRSKMLGTNFSGLLCVVVLFITTVLAQVKKPNMQLIERPTDVKDFKKLLRTKTNVLVFFSDGPETSSRSKQLLSICAVTAEKIYGRGTIAFVNCEDSEGKKLCKKYKATPKPVLLKHYHNGDFHRDYDRLMTAESMTRFMLDPTGDVPWEEENNAEDVVHLGDPASFKRLLKRQVPSLIMFYAPWCGHCKRLKPEYAAAATELKGQSVLAAMDVTRSENTDIQKQFGIKGFPTLLYFEAGQYKYQYGGGNNKDGLIKWMKDPAPPKEKDEAAEQKPWSDEESDVMHLTEATFNDTIEKEPSVLVMFYAPWCGHCKAMKPAYAEAASELKQQAPDTAVLAAIDATVEKSLAERFELQGFPTLKYFKNGEFAFDYAVERTKEKLIEFMLDPKEPPPPPPPEKPWPEVPSDVLHLTVDTFKTELKRKKHAIVMFYAPWCGHCKNAKPHFMDAAAHFKDDPKIAFCAVDCTAHESLCSQYEVRGYPTFYYFSYLKYSKQYVLGNKAADFISYMSEQAGQSEKPTPSEEAATEPPAPAPEVLEFGAAVWQLRPDSFQQAMESSSAALVMFYAPWCPHCKKTKEPYSQAADLLPAGKMLAAFDCTQDVDFCSGHGVKGYPTFHLYENGKYKSDYKGARTRDGFVSAVGETPPKSEL